MSESTIVAPTSAIDRFFAACDRGAALVYHDVVAVETDIAKWRSDNPKVSDLFDQGVQYVSDVLTAHGIPVIDGVLVVKTLGAAMKKMAAGDVGVASGVGNGA